MTTVIVSYDGTDNDRDALALGRLLAGAGASLELAYVSHRSEPEPDSPTDVPFHVVDNPSTAEGLRELVLSRGAEMIVFGSEYRTARGHVDPQATAKRLLEGANATVHAGHKVGLIGPNGCGKSSLFALLRGELHADAGDVSMPPAWTNARSCMSSSRRCCDCSAPWQAPWKRPTI